MTELRGSRVLVTGANGGLGRTIAKTLRGHGCEVIVTGRRAEPLEELAAQIGAKAVIADLAHRSSVEHILSAAGDVDILVANAALPATGDMTDWTEAQIDRVIEVNLTNPILMTRALLPGFRARGRGHFVYISSLSGKVSSKSGAMYSATKFGLRGFAGSLRCDLFGTGVGCSVIFPGFVRDAGMFADTGVTLPRGAGTVSPQHVANGVVKVIRSNKAELDVAPMTLRLGAMVGGLLPGLAAPMQARLDRGMSDAMTQAQKSKR